MTRELDGLIAARTWDTMRQQDIPAGCNLMNCHFIYDLKRNVDGSIAKFKSRLVADGNSQKEGVDFDRVFSTVIKLTTLRLLIIVATKRKLFLSSCDIRQAFLLASVERRQLGGRRPTGWSGSVALPTANGRAEEEAPGGAWGNLGELW